MLDVISFIDFFLLYSSQSSFFLSFILEDLRALPIQFSMPILCRDSISIMGSGPHMNNVQVEYIDLPQSHDSKKIYIYFENHFWRPYLGLQNLGKMVDTLPTLLLKWLMSNSAYAVYTSHALLLWYTYVHTLIYCTNLNLYTIDNVSPLHLLANELQFFIC